MQFAHSDASHAFTMQGFSRDFSNEMLESAISDSGRESTDEVAQIFGDPESSFGGGGYAAETTKKQAMQFDGVNSDIERFRQESPVLTDLYFPTQRRRCKVCILFLAVILAIICVAVICILRPWEQRQLKDSSPGEQEESSSTSGLGSSNSGTGAGSGKEEAGMQGGDDGRTAGSNSTEVGGGDGVPESDGATSDVATNDGATGSGGVASKGLKATGGPVQRNVDGVEFVYEVPSGTVKGVVLLLHGCSHSATDFWHSSEGCRDCIGLPEEVRVRQAGLARGYIAVAVSSSNRKGKCFSSNISGQSAGDDLRYVNTALKNVHETTGAPGDVMNNVIAFGVSSGGSFSAMLPASGLSELGSSVKGLIVNVASIYENETVAVVDSPSDFPAVGFVHMGVRDVRTGAEIDQAMGALRMYGVATTAWKVGPQAVTEEFCGTRVPEYVERCGEIVKALTKGGILDANGNLLSNPRESNWREYVADIATDVGDSLVQDMSALAEIMGVAWGYHEITSDFVHSAMGFVESH